MKKTRFTETQILRALKEGEESRKTEDICKGLENLAPAEKLKISWIIGLTIK